MTTARTSAERRTLEALEARFDGPIPQEDRDILRYGSVTAAEIARTLNSIAYFHGEIEAAKRSAKRWAQRGNDEMARRNLADVELYWREWRRDRARLKELRGTLASLKGAKRLFDTLSPKEDDDAI